VISGGRKNPGVGKGEGNIWRVEIPEVREGKWAFRQLFVNGVRSQRARTPNFGFYRIKGPKSTAVPFQIRYREDGIQASLGSIGGRRGGRPVCMGGGSDADPESGRGGARRYAGGRRNRFQP